jgi:nucleoid-associated protein YejK
MKKKDIEDIAVSIITKIHEYYDLCGMDDSVYIPILKYVIMGAVDSADENDLTKYEQKKIRENLYGYAKRMYQTGCQIHAPENTDQEQLMQESSGIFDYIYEHEEYPT